MFLLIIYFILPKKEEKKRRNQSCSQICGFWTRNLVRILWLLFHLAILSHSKVGTLLVLVRTLTEFYKFFFFGCTMLIITYLEIYIYTFWWMKKKKKEGIYYYYIAYSNRRIVSLLPSIYSMILGSTWKMDVKRDRY